MKTYRIQEPPFPDFTGDPVYTDYTEDDIIEEYWDHWKSLMEKKYGEGHHLINHSNCILDWAVVNWAWEV